MYDVCACACVSTQEGAGAGGGERQGGSERAEKLREKDPCL